MTNSSNNYKIRVGELRPSQILFSFGVGAIADLPNLSVMIMGLEDWDKNHSIEISEERLLVAVRRQLGNQVKKLLLPPIPTDENSLKSSDELARIGIPVAPFPTWMVCPKCHLLAPLKSNFFELKYNPYRSNEACYVHKNCSKSHKAPKVIPVRFLVACDRGHLDDFPWLYFVHKENTNCHGPLRLKEQGISGTAADIVVICDRCDQVRKLSDAFGESGKKNMPRCRGRHPHLRNFDDECNQQMRGLLLGASNSWFPVSLSALSIPNQSGKLAQLIEYNWISVGKANSLEMLEFLLSVMQAKGELQDFAEYPIEDIWQIIEQKQTNTEDTSYQNLKNPEWQVLNTADYSKNTPEFQLCPVAAPTGYEKYFQKIVLVERLREVRALIGFTRLQSPGDFSDIENITKENLVQISRNTPEWVPATEVKGEGIFIEFKEEILRQWEELPAIKKYASLANVAYQNWLNTRTNIEPNKIDKILFPGVRYILIHSFAHALMRQLAIECGYNAASLRERIYSELPEAENGPQAGVLIYTSAPDSEGTLGGLVNLGDPQTLGYLLAQALEDIRLCASDPLCAQNNPLENNNSVHWAACHACLFSPETACERGNKFLDRSLLIPTLQEKELAFFS